MRLPIYWVLYYVKKFKRVDYNKSYTKYGYAARCIDTLSRNKNIEPFLYDVSQGHLYDQALGIYQSVEIDDLETFIMDLMEKDAKREQFQTI
jgi:hypothetical protein